MKYSRSTKYPIYVLMKMIASSQALFLFNCRVPVGSMLKELREIDDGSKSYAS